MNATAGAVQNASSLVVSSVTLKITGPVEAEVNAVRPVADVMLLHVPSTTASHLFAVVQANVWPHTSGCELVLVQLMPASVVTSASQLPLVALQVKPVGQAFVALHLAEQAFVALLQTSEPAVPPLQRSSVLHVQNFEADDETAAHVLALAGQSSSPVHESTHFFVTGWQPLPVLHCVSLVHDPSPASMPPTMSPQPIAKAALIAATNIPRCIPFMCVTPQLLRVFHCLPSL